MRPFLAARDEMNLPGVVLLDPPVLMMNTSRGHDDLVDAVQARTTEDHHFIAGEVAEVPTRVQILASHEVIQVCSRVAVPWQLAHADLVKLQAERKNIHKSKR